MINGPAKANLTTASNPIFNQIEDLTAQMFYNPSEPILGVKDEVVIAPNLRALMERSSTIVTTLEDEDGLLEAFSMTIPLGEMDPRRAIETDTAYVYYIAVQPNLQGEGRVASLMKAMESQLKDQGYGYFELDANISNGFADKLEKAYGEAVVSKRNHAGYEGTGPQRALRVDLSKVPLAS